MQEDDNMENGQVESSNAELHPALEMRNRWLNLISDKYTHADLDDCFEVLRMIRQVVELPRPVPFKKVCFRMSVDDLEFGRLSLERLPEIPNRAHT